MSGLRRQRGRTGAVDQGKNTLWLCPLAQFAPISFVRVGSFLSMRFSSTSLIHNFRTQGDLKVNVVCLLVDMPYSVTYTK